MYIDKSALKVAIKELGRYYNKLDENAIEKIILDHALAAGGAGAIANGVPGAGAVISTAVGIGFVWAMYYRLCHTIGVKISKTKLKVIASVVVAEVAAYLGVILAANILINLIPGLNLGGVVLGALVNFAMAYAAGVLFILMLQGVFKAGHTPDELDKMSDEELSKAARPDKDAVKKATVEGLKTHRSAKQDPRFSGDGITSFDDNTPGDDTWA